MEQNAGPSEKKTNTEYSQRKSPKWEEKTNWCKQKTEEHKLDYDKRNQMRTLARRIQKRKLQWFGHVKQMDNSRLLAIAQGTLEPGDRSQVKQKKDNVKKISINEESVYTECVRDRNIWK